MNTQPNTVLRRIGQLAELALQRRQLQRTLGLLEGELRQLNDTIHVHRQTLSEVELRMHQIQRLPALKLVKG